MLKQPDPVSRMKSEPAAFGRLCVETPLLRSCEMTVPQPPSGGCVLKQRLKRSGSYCLPQPPSGGCVLKPVQAGCVGGMPHPAAFGRLCVETPIWKQYRR